MCSCSRGAPHASGSWFLERPTCLCTVHWEGQCSHYSYNEIIMNGAPRPHHRNIYCIIYSASPLVQGERTHINFQSHSSPPHSGSCLLLKAQAPARLLFHSFVLFLCFIFWDGQREHPLGPWGLNTACSASCECSGPHLYFFIHSLLFLPIFFLFVVSFFIQLEQLNFYQWTTNKK